MDKPEIKEKALKPPALLDKAIDLARDFVIELQKADNIEPISKEQMSVLLLPESIYSELAPGGEAFSSYPDESVYLRYNKLRPNYYWGGIVLHELLHRWLELSSTSYSAFQPDEGAVVTTSHRRGGLISRVITKRGKQLARTNLRGNFTNELGNYRWQQKFQEKLLHLPDFFLERILRQLRLALLRSQGKINGKRISLEQRGIPFTLRLTNIHFDKSGKIMINAPALMSEYIDTLHELIGDIDSQPFDDLLLKMKMEPRLQNKLRIALDRVFGQGYYQKLRKISSVDAQIFKLLAEAQAKLEWKKRADGGT